MAVDLVEKQFSTSEISSEISVSITEVIPKPTKLRASDKRKRVAQQGAAVGLVGVGVGAAIGALIGSIVPGPGTLIGAAVGATIGGFIRAKKKREQERNSNLTCDDTDDIIESDDIPDSTRLCYTDPIKL